MVSRTAWGEQGQRKWGGRWQLGGQGHNWNAPRAAQWRPEAPPTSTTSLNRLAGWPPDSKRGRHRSASFDKETLGPGGPRSGCAGPHLQIQIQDHPQGRVCDPSQTCHGWDFNHQHQQQHNLDNRSWYFRGPETISALDDRFLKNYKHEARFSWGKNGKYSILLTSAVFILKMNSVPEQSWFPPGPTDGHSRSISSLSRHLNFFPFSLVKRIETFNFE